MTNRATLLLADGTRYDGEGLSATGTAGAASRSVAVSMVIAQR